MGANDFPSCPCIEKGDRFQSTTNNRIFRIKSFINYNTRNVIYLITCQACKIQYVGRTTRRLRDRLNNHIYNIVKEHGTNVA